MNRKLHIAVKNTLSDPSTRTRIVEPYRLYADAKPSEAIQTHELPGLAVACLCPIKKGQHLLSVPVKQFKEYKSHKRGYYASNLTKWLAEERENGLFIAGFSLARTQLAAARFGLNMIEELPDTRVEAHHNSFRLFFDDEPIDFAQAIALVYYNFAIEFAILRASLYAPDLYKSFVVYMDRFPGASAGNVEPGIPLPVTPGMKFIQFIRKRSKSSIDITKENIRSGIRYESTTLDWWRPSAGSALVSGKEHPHFALTDWFVASALAQEFEEEFIEHYPHKSTAREISQAMRDLNSEFNKFDVMTIADDRTLEHIVSSDKCWSVPVEARDFIINRAER